MSISSNNSNIFYIATATIQEEDEKKQNLDYTKNLQFAPMRTDRRTNGGGGGKSKGIKLSRIGSYAISSSLSMSDHRQLPCITCTTFNILAPIYKRLSHRGQNSRESDYRAFWFARNQKILDSLLRERSSIICLQEFWVGNQELVNMYEKRLKAAGYLNFSLGRTNNRGDGLLISVRKDYFKVISHRELHFNDCGDRVAQMLHVELALPFSQNPINDTGQDILVVNTHLLFPHDSSLCLVRLHQAYKILQYLEAYQKECKLNPIPIMLCGDWNGSKRGHVYKFLRSQGFESSYDSAHRYTDADAHKWISHLNHRGDLCGVDFIWLLNPNSYRKLLKTSWIEAVFDMFKYLLRRASLTEENAFAFLRGDHASDYITYPGFCAALRQLNLTGQRYGLSDEETRDLWVQVDTDRHGVLNYKEFQKRVWNPTRIEHGEEIDGLDGVEKGRELQTTGFSVENAVLFPPEVEKGRWPENYSLSDHAKLTVVFSPIRMPCLSCKTSVAT